LTIQRGSEQLEMMVEREHIELPTVDSIMLPANTGYLRLFFFNERTAQLTAQALDGLRAQGMEKLILDLRRNPGGLLEDALRVAEMLVPEGPILILEDQLGQRLTRYSYSQGLGMPLVVLIDEGSASAAEIVAGAVRDRAAGTLVGTSTYGKGSVQTIIALDSGAGLKLTSGHFLTPRGIALDGEGLEPDLAVAASVPLGMERPNMPQDDQLRAAWKLLNE
jgi:carboxyl-terminal processing protease